jgi:HK97 family phage prohead protease
MLPWHVARSSECPESKPFAVIKDDSGEIEGCHETEEAARRQMAALYASEENSNMETTTERWDGSASRFNDEQYAKACVLDRGDCQDASEMSAKQRYSLPVANPGSSWSESPDAGGVAAAAQRIGQVDAGAGCIASAKRRLRTAYRKLDMEAPDSLSEMNSKHRRSEVRAYLDPERYEFREANGGPAILQGYIAPFNEWTEIDSVFEGRFMERIAPSAFRKAAQDGKPRVLFQHGHDPSIGEKPIGVVQALEERERGHWYEVELFDTTSYVRDLLPGLAAGQYGTSFRFTAVKEEFISSPERSDYNPDGIPERTVREATLPEFGPVTFPAYEGATADLRSQVLTEEDFIVVERRIEAPREEIRTPGREPAKATPEGAAKASTDYLSGDDAPPDWAL